MNDKGVNIMNEKKIICRQIAPELQGDYELEIMLDDEIISTYCNLFGNRDFNEHTSELFKTVDRMLNDIDSYSDYSELFHDYLPGEITGDKYIKILDLIYNYNYKSHYDILTEILTLITGNQYKYTILCGCCQRDWIECIYAPEFIDINYVECVYFNMGIEFMINVDEADDYEYIQYFITTDLNEIKKDIADSYNLNVDDIILELFDGHKLIPKYKTV
jgi:hypothetical protein